MNNIFFFQTQQILENSNLFDQLKDQKIFFSYFQVDQNYYLLVYAQKSIDINFLYQSIDVIQELDSKQRKIRSFRGFFLYALEIMENGKDDEILSTNLQPFFWRKVKNIIRQNQKAALLEFLFGKDEDQNPQSIGSSPALEKLQNQVNFLQERVLDLENQNIVMEEKLNMLSAAPRSLKFDTSRPKEGHTTFNQNDSNFLSLSQISEQEREEIIQRGFQLQNKEKISLKKYYESTDPNSLFQWKGYNIKYEAIRKNNLYKQLKP